MKDLRDLQGYPLRDENVNIVCYADDATLIADNEVDHQRLLTRFSQSCTKFDPKNIIQENEIPYNLKGTSLL